MLLIYFITAKWLSDLGFSLLYSNPMTTWLPCLAKAASLFQVECQVASSSPSLIGPIDWSTSPTVPPTTQKQNTTSQKSKHKPTGVCSSVIWNNRGPRGLISPTFDFIMTNGCPGTSFRTFSSVVENHFKVVASSTPVGGPPTGPCRKYQMILNS